MSARWGWRSQGWRGTRNTECPGLAVHARLEQRPLPVCADPSEGPPGLAQLRPGCPVLVVLCLRIKAQSDSDLLEIHKQSVASAYNFGSFVFVYLINGLFSEKHVSVPRGVSPHDCHDGDVLGVPPPPEPPAPCGSYCAGAGRGTGSQRPRLRGASGARRSGSLTSVILGGRATGAKCLQIKLF